MKGLGHLEQISMFDLNRGKELAAVGLDMAVENAEKKEKGWSTRCWQLFLYWLRRKKHNDEFMIEDFRKYLMDYDLIEDPPSLRAYGFISVKAKKAGFIQFVRTEKVKNTKAHAANASVWRRVYFGKV
ncbi:MAG TPA: hypothetical protein PKI55_12770 [Chitinophagaceae bacterium]|nr:hypothetical protein [Chitinophagaceae bacterium]